MNGVGHVRADATMNVLGAVHRPLSSVGSPPCGGQHMDTCVIVTLVEMPRRLQYDGPDRDVVDVTVGRPERDTLEARQRLAELLAVRRVVSGHSQRAPGDAGLQGSERYVQP